MLGLSWMVRGQGVTHTRLITTLAVYIISGSSMECYGAFLRQPFGNNGGLTKSTEHPSITVIPVRHGSLVRPLIRPLYIY